MQISVRSYLTAGMAAVVGATAISLAPLQPAPAPQAVALAAPAVAEIALTGTSIPWETIAAVVQALSSGGSLSSAVGSLLSSVGTEFVKEALPLVTALAGDLVKYVGTALADLLSGPGAPQIDFAAILATATAAINAGDVPAAVKALTSGLSAPLTQIGEVLFTPEFQAFVTGKIGSVLGALPEILRSAVQKVVGIDIKPLIDELSGLLFGILPAATTLTASRALSAAAESATVVDNLTAIGPAPAADVPAASVAPDGGAAPAAAPGDSPAKAPAVEAATEAAPAAEAAPDAAPAEAAPVAAPAAEVVDATLAAEVAAPSVPTEAVAPAASSPAAAPEAADSADVGRAVVTRLSKPGPRAHASAPKAAESRAGAAAGRG